MRSETVDEKMLGRVRGLLAKAESTEYPKEAEELTAKAAALMAKYGIDRAMAEQSAPTQERVTHLEIKLDAPYAREKGILLNAVAMNTRCRMVQHSYGRTVDSATVFGFPTDLELLQVLYTSLLVQSARMLARAVVPWDENPKAYRRSWLQGFAGMINVRLAHLNRTAQGKVDEERGGGTALVLADRSAQVDLVVENRYPNLTAGRARRLSGTGRRAGARAARDADIGVTKLGTNDVRRITA